MDENKIEKRIAIYNRIWMKIYGFMVGIRQKVYGLENINPNQSYVVVCNHSSNVDTVIFPRSNILPVRPLAKSEIKKMPVLGYLFKKAGVYVDRSSKESRKKSMDRMRELVQRNVSVFIFPEGTRNKTDQPLKPFYDGAFRLAIETGVPILPVVLTGAKKILSHKSKWAKPALTKVIYLEPVDVKNYTMENLDELKQKVFQMMEKTFLEYS